MPVSTGVNFCMQGCWSFFYPKKINTKKNDGTQRALALQGKNLRRYLWRELHFFTHPSGKAGSTGASPEPSIRTPGAGFNPETKWLNLSGHSGALRNIIYDLPSTGAGIRVQKEAWDFPKEREIVF